jgi:hypothetical protein
MIPRIQSRAYCMKTMRGRSLLAMPALLSLMTAYALSPRTHFVWDWRHSQELSYKRTLQNSTELTTQDKTAIRKTISGWVHSHADGDSDNSAVALKALLRNLRIKAVDLNGDGIPEFVVQPTGPNDWCGATGNCVLWIFQRSERDFSLIFDSEQGNGVGAAEMFNVLPHRTNGYSDLVLAAHDSASEKTLFLYKFDGRQYRPHECYDADWQTYTNGEVGYSKEPTITTCEK